MATKSDSARLQAKAKQLARKFYDDAQALFDDAAMTDEIYDSEVMQALVGAQGYAEDVMNAALSTNEGGR